MSRPLVLVGLAAAVALTAPALGTAAVRYTSPTGAGVACSQASPCTLGQALTGSVDGDEIRLARDEYNIGSSITVSHSITISGPDDLYSQTAFWPYLLMGTGNQLLIQSPNVRLERLAVVGSTNGALVGAGSSNSGLTVNRAMVTQNGTGPAVLVQNGNVTNSLVRALGASATAVEATGAVVGTTALSTTGTAVSNDENWHAGPDCALSVANTLARGASRNLYVDNTGGACTPTVHVDWSWVPTSGAGGGYFPALPNAYVTRGPVNVADSPGPIVSDSYFSSTYELQPGSSGVNVGAGGLTNQSTDLYGRPRPIGSAPDIGAIETVLAPTAGTVTASGVTASVAHLDDTVNPDFAATSYRFQYREQGASAWTDTATAPAGAGASDVSVGADITGLAAGRTYEARVWASNDIGTTITPESTFSTAAAPSTSGAPAGAPAVGSLSALWTRRGRDVTVGVTLFPGATGYRISAMRTKPSAASRTGRCIAVSKRVAGKGARVKSQRCTIRLGTGTWTVAAEGRKGATVVARAERSYTLR